MFVSCFVFAIGVITITDGFPWENVKNNNVDKLTSILRQDDSNELIDQLKQVIERLYSNKPNLLNAENIQWSDDKDTPNIDNSDKMSRALALLLTDDPLRSCQEKYLINIEQFLSCVKELEENSENKDVSKRRDGMMKLNPTGWKRKRRDTYHISSSRERDSRTNYDVNQLINRLLVEKRQRMRFNPTGW